MSGSRIFAPGALEGVVALVTGGGTNLGRAAAAELVRCGAVVTIAGRREEILREAAAEIGCAWVAGDIREPSGASSLVEDVVAREGRLDFLLNNAGGQYFVPAEAIAEKGWRAVQRLNVSGSLNMCETAAAAMGADVPAAGPALAAAPAPPSRGGTIVNVTVSPHHGMPAMAHTGTARAVVESLTRELADRWEPHGIAVAAIALGRFATESLKKYPAELWRRAAESVPLQRLGEMDEYGWLVALLASPLGRSFTGSVLTLDGALDNWTGPWPPAELTRDGTVPTEDRAAGVMPANPGPGEAVRD